MYGHFFKKILYLKITITVAFNYNPYRTKEILTQYMNFFGGNQLLGVQRQARMGHKEHRDFSRCAGHFGAGVKKLIYTHNNH